MFLFQESLRQDLKAGIDVTWVQSAPSCILGEFSTDLSGQEGSLSQSGM